MLAQNLTKRDLLNLSELQEINMEKQDDRKVQTSSFLAISNYKYFADIINVEDTNENLIIKEIGIMFSALKGWNKQDNILGPCYLPKESVSKELIEFLKTGTKLTPQSKKSLMELKASAVNFQSFFTDRNLRATIDFEQDIEDFLQVLKSNVSTLKNTFDAINLSPAIVDFCYKIFSKTAPILYSMGFEDAIHHSTQVSRKCIIETYKAGGCETEILQAAIVGWLHDPKFPISISWTNLATHPIIAGSLAYKILNEEELKQDITKIFNGNIEEIETFIIGIAEALFVNNDSAFVMNKVILHKFKFVPHSENGNANWLKSMEKTARDRFIAPSLGESLPVFSDEVQKQINKTSLDTGIKGIVADKLELILKELSIEFSELHQKPYFVFWEELIAGEIKNKDLLSKVKNKLETTHGTVSLRVKGNSLFFHHMEVENAKLAANSLIIADSMLLSPYKILVEGLQDTSLGRITSFCQSFNDNVKYITQEYQVKAKSWQKKIYMSLLESADELTNGSALIRFEELASSISVDEQINVLFDIVKAEETWGIYANISPKAPEDSSDFKKLAETIKSNYDKVAENSTEMFAI